MADPVVNLNWLFTQLGFADLNELVAENGESVSVQQQGAPDPDAQIRYHSGYMRRARGGFLGNGRREAGRFIGYSRRIVFMSPSGHIAFSGDSFAVELDETTPPGVQIRYANGYSREIVFRDGAVIFTDLFGVTQTTGRKNNKARFV